MKKGLFITFEGPDGSGKTTVATIVCQKLSEKGYEVVHTREPGGIDIAEQIRKVILDPKNTAMDAKTEALLYAASRRQHLVEKVYPAVEKGKVVICERFLDSSIAYQGFGRGLGAEDVIKINEFAIDNTYPDKTIYLDVDEETGLARIKDRAEKDRLDEESLAFHQRVVEGYKAVLKMFKQRIAIIDATRSIDEVVEESLKIIQDLLNDR